MDHVRFNEMNRYADALHANNPNNSPSISGYVLTMRDAPVGWSLKLHTNVDKSSSEA